jgi:hypothetical protein
MRKLTSCILFFALFLCFQSCEKSDLPNQFDTITDPEFIDLQFQSENFGNPTLGNFIGVVKDEFGSILEGVQIQIGNAMTTTDRNGVFIMNDINVFENFAYIQAQKTGYIDGSRVVIPKENGVNRIEIQLLEKRPDARIMSGEVSEVSVNGAKVTFQGDFITASDGNAYTGPVDVVFHYLRPNGGSLFFQMPGNLFAQTASNSARSLETYGMVSVSLFSPSNQELNIDPNSTATIEFPIDFTQTGIAPETIPLWSFDEEVGYWKEEGEATKENNTYIAEVNHFSWWNCDIPLDYVELCFTLNPLNINGAEDYLVAIQRTINDQYIYYGYNTSGDVECGWIPQDETVKIQVFAIISGCANQLVHEEVVGGFATDASVEVSFTNDAQANTSNITGTVTNCNGNPLTDGYLYIDGDNIASITDGIIDVNVTYCNTLQIYLQVYDANTGQFTTTPLELNGDDIDVGTLSTCEDSGGVYNGNVRLTTQQEVNDFAQFNYSVINGDLFIGHDFNSGNDPNIIDLSLFTSLETVTGRVTIINNSALTDLNGLTNLRSVDWLSVGGNQSLVSLAGIQNIEDIRWFNLYNNNALTSLDDLQSWDFELPILSITQNSNLTSISGLSNVLLSGSVYLEDLSELTTFEELNFADSLNWFQIHNNDALTSLSGLENITAIQTLLIGGNDSLQNLQGLENLMDVRGFFIGIVSQTDIFVNAGNPALTDFCAVRNLFLNGTFVDPPTSIFTGTFIENNVFNPTVQDIQDGNCSL